MSQTSKIYRYSSNLQIAFPEGLENIRFLKEIEGFNYISVTKDKKSKILLPVEFEEASLPEDFLEEKRQEKYAKIEDLRKDLQFQNISYQDGEFSASQMARQNMIGIIMLEIVATGNTQSETYYWQDNKEKPYQFNRDDFKNITNEISLRDSKLYFIEAEIRSIIKNETDIDSLESFDVASTWNVWEEKYKKSKVVKVSN